MCVCLSSTNECVRIVIKMLKKIKKSRLVLLDIKAYYKAVTIKNLVLA